MMSHECGSDRDGVGVIGWWKGFVVFVVSWSPFGKSSRVSIAPFMVATLSLNNHLHCFLKLRFCLQIMIADELECKSHSRKGTFFLQ